MLRPFTLDDFEPDRVATEHPSTARWLNDHSDGGAAAVLAEMDAEQQAGRMLVLTIADANDHRFLGSIVLFVKEHATGELAYLVAPEARGRGLAHRAVTLLGDWGVAELGLQRLQLRIDPENVASHAVARAAGYEREGVLRSSFVVRGSRRDAVMYSRLPGDPPPAT